MWASLITCFRSRDNLTSPPHENISTENDLGCVNVQPPISEDTRDIGDSAARDNPDSGYYMEIQNVALSGTDSVVGGDRATGTVQETPGLLVNFTSADAYAEVLDTVTGCPITQDGMTESPRQMRPGINKLDRAVHEKGSRSYDSSVTGDASNTNSSHTNDHKSVSVLKAADETGLMYNDIYESVDGMAAVANDKPISYVKAADETEWIDNGIFKNGGGRAVVVDDAHEKSWGLGMRNAHSMGKPRPQLLL